MIHRNDAIVVSPNYRLLPEHSGEEIQEDLRDFWTWYVAISDTTLELLTTIRFQDGGVEKYLTSQDVDLKLDHKRVLVGGDSAGGYLAIQSGLIRPKGDIRAIVGSYPMTNYLRRKQQEVFMGEPAPPPSIIDVSTAPLLKDSNCWLMMIQEHLASVGPGAVISGAQPRPRNRVSYALSAYGRYNEFFGVGAHLWPISLLPHVGYLPPTLILHGDADTAVDIGDSRGFVNLAEEILGDEADIRLVELEGMDHGFDMDAVESEDWVKDVVAWIEERWLA